MNTEHVWGYSCELSCINCGQSPKLDAMSAVALVDVIRGFLLMHRRCEQPVEPSKQVELFDALAAKEQALFQKDEHPERSFSGIDASTDEPAPEIDPPGIWECPSCVSGHPVSEPCPAEEGNAEHDKPELTDQDDPFGKQWPMARDPSRLRVDLSVVLQGVLVPTAEQISGWTPRTPVFDRVAQWTRMELARMNAKEHPELDVYLMALPMPRELAALRVDLKAKEAAPRKKRAGARPLTSPSAELPAVAPAKKTRKRRSGSTDHSS